MSKLKLNFSDQNEFFLSLDKEYKPNNFAYPNSCISLDADIEAQLKLAWFTPSSEMFIDGRKIDNSDGFTVSYDIDSKKSKVDINVKTFDNLNLLYQNTKITNNDKVSHILTQITSSNVNGICYDEGKDICDRLSDGSIIIHYAYTKWQGEGQWRSGTPEDLGIYDTTNHPWERAVFRIDSISTWCNSAYYPMIVIEDKKKGECWFFDLNCGNSWFIEIYSCSGKSSKFLSLKMGGADERLGLNKVLKPKESFTSCNSVYGLVKGGFEEAVKELTKFRRLNSIYENGIPLTYNDFMCCNWGIESNERLLPLVDKAKELGVEYFCIDDGWQVEQGVWKCADEKFGELKVKGILKYISDRGMKPGVWFEFENVPYKLKDEIGDGDNAFLFRYDKLLAPHRTFGNFRSKKLCSYLMKKIDMVYKMGVRFIKNDHNNNEAIGTTIYGESPAEGLNNNYLAFLEFIDKVRAKYPDLVIEHCAAGANRCDGETLRHFNVQSSSDQEDYYRYTSIIGGSEAYIQPEKCGIWAYPYPLYYPYLYNYVITEDVLKTFVDGEQTIFNMVNASMGGMYLSGRIDQMDSFNFNLMKEGVELYKKRSDFIKSSYPIYPKGMIRISDKTEYAFGLINDDKTEIQLAVWNLSDSEREVRVDLSKYGLKHCEMIYPVNIKGVKVKYNKKELICKFTKGRQARLFKIYK